MSVILSNIELVGFSFLASLGLAIVFQIDKKNLLWAGLGGALTRCVYLLMIAATDRTFVQSLCAAMFAALYAEILAMRQRMPSTVFLYPSIIPLIPGSLLYYICVNVLLGNRTETISYLTECLLSLGGICLGFVLISTFTYYRRIYYMGKNIESHIKRFFKWVIKSLWGKTGRSRARAGGESAPDAKAESARGNGSVQSREEK